ncbi:MAG: ATP-dependent zinc metalloprotease FtsH [Spirochaetota bacterium]
MPQDENDRNDQDQGEGQGPRPSFNWRLIVPLVLIFVLLSTFINLFQGAGSGEEITYSQFKQLVSQGEIRSVTIQGDRVTGRSTAEDAPTGLGGRTGFTTYVPRFGDPELLTLLEENNVEIDTRPSDQPSFFGVLISILPYIFLLWIFFSLFRNIRGQGRGIFQVGENKAKLYEQTKERTTFSDVAGLEGAKEEVMEIVDFLKDPSRYRELGARSPKGILLVGPPGTGKTLIARAIAGEAGVPFFSMSGSDFMEMFVGVGASRVRNLFRDAKKKSPSIIFIDELDSIGRHRGAGLGGGHDEREQTLNQMLSELDGFEQNESTVVIAATNRPDILDPALLRPGRFDRQVTIPMPTKSEREEILIVHAREKPMDPSVDLGKVATRTIGFSGAELQNLLNEAALQAARRRAKTITDEDIDMARDRLMMGLERRSIKMTDRERRITAYHEAGHAITAALLPNMDPVTKVTIVPRGRALGVTQLEQAEERYNYSREYLEDMLSMMLGGRAAEMLTFNSMTSGAADDLKRATETARQMVSMWGMSDNLAHIALGEGDRDVFLGEQLSRQRSYSEATAREIDEEVKSILRRAFTRSEDLLRENKRALDELAELLLEQEQVSGAKVKELVGIAGTTDTGDDE